MGFDIASFILFVKQAGLAVAGAAALWGLVFAIYAGRKKHTTDHVLFEWLTRRLFWLMIASFVAAVSGWLLTGVVTIAHEGIVIVPTLEQTIDALILTEPLYYFWIALTFAGLLLRVCSSKWFGKALVSFLALEFITIFVLASIPAWTGGFDNVQFFFFGHNFHSIFTVGTVIVLDFLFLSSKSSLLLKQNIFPFFPIISKVIWVGLGIDFLSVALVFQDAIVLTPKFFFMQTVVGILIINGALLSGPLTRILLKTVQRDGVQPTWQQILASDLAGTISITSWLSITFVDFFYHLTFTYWQFLSIYLVCIAVLFVGHRVWEYFDQGEPEYLHVH